MIISVSTGKFDVLLNSIFLRLSPTVPSDHLALPGCSACRLRLYAPVLDSRLRKSPRHARGRRCLGPVDVPASPLCIPQMGAAEYVHAGTLPGRWSCLPPTNINEHSNGQRPSACSVSSCVCSTTKGGGRKGSSFSFVGIIVQGERFFRSARRHLYLRYGASSKCRCLALLNEVVARTRT